MMPRSSVFVIVLAAIVPCLITSHALAQTKLDAREALSELSRRSESLSRAGLACIVTYRSTTGTFQGTIAYEPSTGAFFIANDDGTIGRDRHGRSFGGSSARDQVRFAEMDSSELGVADYFPTAVVGYIVRNPDTIIVGEIDQFDRLTITFTIRPEQDPYFVELSSSGMVRRFGRGSERGRDQTELAYHPDSLAELPFVKERTTGFVRTVAEFEYSDGQTLDFSPQAAEKAGIAAFQFKQRRLAEMSAENNRKALGLAPGETPKGTPDTGALPRYRTPIVIAGLVILLLAGLEIWRRARA